VQQQIDHTFFIYFTDIRFVTENSTRIISCEIILRWVNYFCLVSDHL